MIVGHDPVFGLRTDTKDITGILEPHLIEMRLHDRSGAHADSLELELADNGALPLPEEGAVLHASIGYQSLPEARKRQQFMIDQIEHSGPPAALELSATTADFTSQARAPRERSFPGITIGELVERIAGEHGYKAMVQPQSLANVHLWHVDQAGQSDLALIYQIAREYGAVFKPVDGVWWVRSYDEIGEPAATIRPSDVTSWRAHFIARNQYRSVVAHYQDYDLARRVPVQVGDGEPRLVLDRTFLNADTAHANAASAFGRARRESRRLSLRMPGRPDLSSQSVIRLEGFRDRVDDDWLITSVTHTINKRGYTCRVECEGV